MDLSVLFEAPQWAPKSLDNLFDKKPSVINTWLFVMFDTIPIPQSRCLLARLTACCKNGKPRQLFRIPFVDYKLLEYWYNNGIAVTPKSVRAFAHIGIDLRYEAAQRGCKVGRRVTDANKSKQGASLEDFLDTVRDTLIVLGIRVVDESPLFLRIKDKCKIPLLIGVFSVGDVLMAKLIPKALAPDGRPYIAVAGTPAGLDNLASVIRDVFLEQSKIVIDTTRNKRLKTLDTEVNFYKQK